MAVPRFVWLTDAKLSRQDLFRLHLLVFSRFYMIPNGLLPYSAGRASVTRARVYQVRAHDWIE